MKRMGFLFLVLLCCCVILIVGFKHLSETPIVTATRCSKITTGTQTITSIPLPEGFTRIPIAENSFAAWLRNIQLRKDNTVYLYNGKPLADQSTHYAVLDISTGNKDLQQCADAIMRLKAEYYFSKKEYDSIQFRSAMQTFNFQKFLNKTGVAGKDLHNLLLQFMGNVFVNCGTYTIDEMTRPIKMQALQAGDVFVKAGAPGHAMIVVDVAENNTGKKIYLLAQGYMPAQDMHIVINPNSSTLNPWYEVTDDEKIITPGWIFSKDQLKRWK